MRKKKEITDSMTNIVKFLYDDYSTKIIRDYYLGKYLNNKKYLTTCCNKAKTYKIVKLDPGVYGRLLCTTITEPATKDDVEEIRKRLNEKFTELVNTLKDNETEANKRINHAKALIENTLAKYNGTYSFITDKHFTNLLVYPKISNKELAAIRIKITPEDKLLSDIDAFDNYIKTWNNLELEQKKEQMIRGINCAALPGILDSILSPLEMTFTINDTYYEERKDCTLFYRDRKVRTLTIGLFDNMNASIERLKNIATNAKMLIDITVNNLGRLTHRYLYDYIFFDHGIILINRGKDRLARVVVKKDNNSIDSRQATNQINKLFTAIEVIDILIDELDPGNNKKWHLDFFENHFSIRKNLKLNRIIYYNPKIIESGISENEARRAILGVLRAESDHGMILKKMKNAFNGQPFKLDPIRFPEENKYEIRYKIGDNPLYNTVIIDAEKDIDKQIDNRIKKIKSEIKAIEYRNRQEDLILQLVSDKLEGYPVKAGIYKNNSADAYTVSVSIPNQPAVVKTIHIDKRMDSDINELIKTVVRKLMILKII